MDETFITYELKLTISHCASAEISEERNLRKAKKRDWQNLTQILRL